MKRITTLALAVIMALALMTPGYAAESTLTQSGGAGSTIITFSVTPTFTIIIPDTFAITTTAQEKSVEVENGGLIAHGMQLTVTATSENPGSGNVFQIKDTETGNAANVFPYTVKEGTSTGTNILSGGTVLTASATEVNAGKSVKLFFALSGPVTIAGSYSDTVSFYATVAAPPVSP